MLKASLKIVGTVFVVCLFLNGESKELESKVELAKRSLLEREQEFLKSQPLSDDLIAFIERYKRRSKETRHKRSQNVDDNLYIIQNGHLVPVKAAKNVNVKRSDNSEMNSNVEAFTVVPLVIPLVNKQQESKLVKIRTLTDDADLKADPLAPAQPAPAPAAPADAVALGPPTPAPFNQVATTPASLQNSTSADHDSEDNNNEQQSQEEKQVLQKILQDVEGLMQSKQETTKKEGTKCSLNGSWVSDAAGMRFDICYENTTRKKFRIHVADRIPPNEDGFLCDGNWTVFGELPFLHSSLVIVLAVHQRDKHIATFIGECRVCEGSETVTGTWLLGRSSRDCKDQKVAHKILSDVWKKEQAHTLRKKHLLQLGYNSTNED